MLYDNENIFAKIIRKEIPCNFIYDNQYALSFYDISPKAEIHALVIPTGKYLCSTDFFHLASEKEIVEYYRAINQTINILNIQNGYRLISNSGENANQEVLHFHTHILAGQPLGGLLEN